jgi:hypothetical protein
MSLAHVNVPILNANGDNVAEITVIADIRKGKAYLDKHSLTARDYATLTVMGVTLPERSAI